ncbi:hypothetical protein BDQ17DRAFT_1504449 [Cyathus striatus]|nr:hypothetical protein BDQ17DRAFT_1504449 [Cyathus striatus]
MIPSFRRSRQPHRVPWTYERLLRERAITLGYTIDRSTALNYSSALNSFLHFCDLHGFSYEPTENSLSFYLVFMASSVSTSTLTTYLSGIVKLLSPYFPNITRIRNSAIVRNTLQGCRRRHFSHPNRKPPLPLQLLSNVCHVAFPVADHDLLLCLAILVSGFYALMRLGELVFPDDPALRDYRKLTPRSSVKFHPNHIYQFTLPTHKADKTFEGDVIIVQRLFARGPDPHLIYYMPAFPYLHLFLFYLVLHYIFTLSSRSLYSLRVQ